MATLTIRGLDDDTHARLRVRAAEHGRSMEAEVRAILKDVLARPNPDEEYGFGSRMHARFAAIDGAELDIPPRTDLARGVDFDE
ncbi:MAG TPA: Arc family DNA-binding protein [Streptosporangiales bacterium]